MSPFPSRSTNYPPTHVVFSYHISSDSFNLKHYLSLSPCFSKSQRVTDLSFCRAWVHLTFPHDQTQTMHSWQDYNDMTSCSQCSTTRGHPRSAHATTSDGNFDHLAKVVFTRFCHWQFTMSLLYLITILGEVIPIWCQYTDPYETSTHKTYS